MCLFRNTYYHYNKFNDVLNFEFIYVPFYNSCMYRFSDVTHHIHLKSRDEQSENNLKIQNNILSIF